MKLFISLSTVPGHIKNEKVEKQIASIHLKALPLGALRNTRNIKGIDLVGSSVMFKGVPVAKFIKQGKIKKISFFLREDWVTRSGSTEKEYNEMVETIIAKALLP